MSTEEQITEQHSTEEKKIRALIGQVVSTNMDKSVTVVVERLVRHPVYGKYIRRSNKLLAHDEANSCKEGDKVAIVECRPISKRKSWKVAEIVQKSVSS